MAENIEARFERYCDVVCRRASPCGSARAGMLVSEGGMLPGGRKSIEPMTRG